MFQDASQRKFDVLLFWSLDRLSREGVLPTLQHLDGDVVDWLRTNAKQALQGFQPRVSAGGNTAPQVLSVWAAQPGARDLSSVDQRPITSTTSGQFYNLS
jgi:hypothetical protein